MNLIQLDIRGISYSQSRSGAYALVLNEVTGNRTLPVVIGAFEAQSIAIALENDLKPPRPLTHDLFVNFAKLFHIKITKVIIHKLVDGVFYSSLVCEKDKKEFILDSRTSDAIAIAVRIDAPIYTYENILEKAGIENLYSQLKEEEQTRESEPAETKQDIEIVREMIQELESAMGSYDNQSLDELEKLLQEAIENEDYEKAAQIRDEINRRKQS